MIVVEYCRFGNMSNYLRKHRSTYMARTRKRRIVSKEYDNDMKQKDLGRSSTDEGEIAEVFAMSEESALVDCCEENRYACTILLAYPYTHGSRLLFENIPTPSARFDSPWSKVIVSEH